MVRTLIILTLFLSSTIMAENGGVLRHRRDASRPKAAAGGGSTFVNDTFTGGTDGDDLTTHTGETGATWAKVTGVTGKIEIRAGRAGGDAGGFSLYYASGSPTTAEYDVQADIVYLTDVDEVWICGRVDTSAHTCYCGGWDNTINQYNLLKIVSGTVTSLGTYAGTSAENHTVKLQIRDAAKKLFVDGVEQISSADNAITAAGKAGIRYDNSDWGAGTGRMIDNFTATNP